MRRLLAVCLSALLGWGFSAADGGRPCAFTAEFTLAPGLSMAPGSGTFTSGGETGRIVCGDPTGTGAARAGDGRFGAEGRYGTSDPDACTGGEGTGVQSFTAATERGPVHVTNAIRFAYQAVGDGGAMAGRFEGERFSGTFRIVPLEGDCFTAPVTRVWLEGHGHLRI